MVNNIHFPNVASFALGARPLSHGVAFKRPFTGREISLIVGFFHLRIAFAKRAATVLNLPDTAKRMRAVPQAEARSQEGSASAWHVFAGVTGPRGDFAAIGAC